MVAKVSDSAESKEKTSKTVSSWRLGPSSTKGQHRNVTKTEGTNVQSQISSNLRNALLEACSLPGKARKNVSTTGASETIGETGNNN